MVSMTLQLRYAASSSSLSTEIEETQMIVLERLGKLLAVVRPNDRGEVMWSSAVNLTTGTRWNMNYANLRV